MAALRRRHSLQEDMASISSKSTLPERSQNNAARTLTWDQIPDWQKDNEYILTGYRRTQYSFRGCAASIYGYLHNETMNIHTHLLGGVLFLVFLFTFQQVYFVHYEQTNWKDFTVFAIFISAAIFCLFASAFFHAFGVHSEEVAIRCHALDYTGIVVLTVGSFVPSIYYGFYCEPLLQKLYLTMIFSIGAGAAYIVLNPEYRKPTHRGARTFVFITLGLSGIVPVTHGLLTHGVYKLCYEMGFRWLLAEGFFYISGALLYANRIPERFSPGTFDYWFASHQIFHVHVVLAALSHYAHILIALNHWHSRIGSCLA